MKYTLRLEWENTDTDEPDVEIELAIDDEFPLPRLGDGLAFDGPPVLCFTVSEVVHWFNTQNDECGPREVYVRAYDPVQPQISTDRAEEIREALKAWPGVTVR